MRARSLKPGFFKNEYLAELGPYAQLLFEGLWCLADRDGKLEDRPKRIKAEIFPYYDPEPGVESLLCKLQEAGFISRYSVNGFKLIKVLNFTKHQSPHSTEKPSIYPDPPQNSEGLSLINESASVNSRKHNALTTDSPTTDFLATSPKGEVVGGPAPPSTDHPQSGVGCLEGFEPPDCDALPENKSDNIPGGNGNGAKQTLTPNLLAALWNDTADKVFPRVILPCSEKRTRKLRPAIREQPDPEWWRALFIKAGGIPFLRGENGRGWRADLEFVVRNRVEILEGRYDQAQKDIGGDKRPDERSRADPQCPRCGGRGIEIVEGNGRTFGRPCVCRGESTQVH